MKFWIIVISVLILDQVTKYFVLTRMQLSESIPLISGILHITYVRNPGAAFGLFAYQTAFFIVITVLIGAVIIYFNYTLPKTSTVMRFALAALLGGALGNLIDRIQTGYVIDFIDFRIWPVFNIADIAIVSGAAILAIELWRESDSLEVVKKDE